MATRYFEAPEVRDVARPIIAEHHAHLLDIRIEYVFRSDTASKGGKDVWGTARKVSNLQAYLASGDEDGEGEAFFVIEIARPVWIKLNDQQKSALVDHELCHCWREDEEKDDRIITKLSLLPHDLEEFHSIYARYGAWRPDLAEFEKEADRQLMLPLDTGGDRASQVTRGMAHAIRDLCPGGDSGLSKVSFSANGGEPVELTAETRKRLDAKLGTP